jgi:hypothetical protein
MAVRLSSLTCGPLPPRIFLVLISVRGRVDPRTTVRLEGLDQLKNPVNSSGIEPATFLACSVVLQVTTIPHRDRKKYQERKLLTFGVLYPWAKIHEDCCDWNEEGSFCSWSVYIYFYLVTARPALWRCKMNVDRQCQSVADPSYRGCLVSYVAEYYVSVIILMTISC